MRRVVCIVVIGQVAADTGSRYGIVINTVVALVAAGRDMCAGQRPVCIVYREGGRFPARVGCMAIGAGRRDLGSLVVRIQGSIIIGLVTTDTGIRGRGVIAIMALVTTGRSVGAGQGIVCIVNCESGRFPARVGGMTLAAVVGKIGCLVVRICCCCPIGLMTVIALLGKTGKAPIRVALSAIDCMTQGQREEGVVNIGGIPGYAVYRMALDTIF